MSSVDEPSACSSQFLDPDYACSFHVQPDSLSHGYEQTYLEEDYNQHDLVPKLKFKSYKYKNGSVFKKYFEIKKPLDERRLCQAVSMNDSQTVLHLLQRGVSAVCKDSHLRSPLHLAACKGYGHIVRMLLEHGADPNARDLMGNTALHLAACTNHIDVVTLLLNAGTDACSVDKLGRSPLQLAQSKLRVLRRSRHPDHHVKQQVSQVIEMLMMFYKEGEKGDNLQRLQTSLQDQQDGKGVDHQLRQLLSDLTSLCLE